MCLCLWLFVLVCVSWLTLTLARENCLQSADAYFDHRPVQARILGALARSQLRSRESAQDRQRRTGRRLAAGLLLAERVRLQQVLEVTVRLGSALWEG